MPATLVAKLAPAPPERRARTANNASLNENAPDFKQALAEARPKTAPHDRPSSADTSKVDASSAEAESTASRSNQSPRAETPDRSPGKKTDAAVDATNPTEPVTGVSEVAPIDDAANVKPADETGFDPVFDPDAPDAALPSPITDDQPDVVVPVDADTLPDASKPIEAMPGPAIAASAASALPEASTADTADTATDKPLDGAATPSPTANLAATPGAADPAAEQDVGGDAKLVAAPTAVRQPAAGSKPAAPQPSNSVVDPVAAGDVDSHPSTDAGGNSEGNPSARHPHSAVQAQSASAAEPAGSTQKSGDFVLNPGDSIDQLDADKNTAATSPTARSAAPLMADKPAPSPQQAFAQQNHERIVSSVRTQLLPNGGSMQIRLQPGNLGNMQISVRMIDGVMSASFQTSSDEATRLLSHSLSQLKTTLETQGIQVDRIQVTQASREASAPQDNQPNDSNRQNHSRQEQQQHAHEENQRRLILNRMWRKMATGEDPLDLVA